MTKELFELLQEIAGALKSLANDVGYFADKARKQDAPPAPAPPAPPVDPNNQ